MSWQQRIDNALQQQRDQHLWRHPALLGSAQGVRVKRDGQWLTNFCSNDYLGLAQQGGDALAAAAQHWQLGSGASHMVCGHSEAHQQLEQALAAHTGYDRALLFSTGYMANLGVISALTQRGDDIFQDKLNHASLLDGGLLSRAKMSRYHHSDIEHLQQLLANDHGGERLIVTDSLFSMDGDLAPVSALAELAQQQGALLMVDDAHGFAVLGDHGEGVRHACQLTATELPVYIGTLGKGLGGFGAFVAGSDSLIDYLTQFTRSYIYTTALPPALADAMLANLERVKCGDLQARLNTNIAYFRHQATQYALPLMPSESAIQPLLIGESQQAMALSQHLLAHGFWVSAIRPPTVPQGSARLRITLSAAHSHDDIDALLKVLVKALKKTLEGAV